MTRSKLLPSPYYDPYSRDINADPFDTFKRLRDEAPLYHNADIGFYALSRYADIRDARADVTTFSNTHGILFERMLDRPSDLPRTMVVEQDPPEHTMFRHVTLREFTPKSVARIEQQIRDVCGQLLDPHLDADSFDYVEDFGRALPMIVTSQLLGLEAAQQQELLPTFIDMEAAIASESPDIAEINRYQSDVRARMLEFAADRRQWPREDLLTELVNARIDDPATGPRSLTDAELASYCLVLYTGGNSTTMLLFGWLAAVLGQRPDQRRMLLERPDLIANAVEETLRYEPVSHSQGRYTTCDVELHGETVPAGSLVLLLTGAACRDERQFDRPDEFDVARKLGNTMAFGWGIHMCLGAPLARLEARVALEETLRRFPDWNVDEEAGQMRITSAMRGYAKLPFHPER